MKWTVSASMEQKSLAQVRLLPNWIWRAGLDTWGKGNLECHSSGWWIWRSKGKPVNSREVWKLPKTVKWAPLPACSFLGKANWVGGQLALWLWLGSVRGQSSPKSSPMSTHPVGGPLLEGKGQDARGNIKLSTVTWMRFGKANQADAQWSWVLFKLRQFYTKCMEKEIKGNQGQVQYIWL